MRWISIELGGQRLCDLRLIDGLLLVLGGGGGLVLGLVYDLLLVLARLCQRWLGEQG